MMSHMCGYDPTGNLQSTCIHQVCFTWPNRHGDHYEHDECGLLVINPILPPQTNNNVIVTFRYNLQLNFK
jgi:hypothetical protein